MATFDNFNKIMEDTIRVDMKKRWTPQLVKFINNKNEFYGFFNGKLNATGGTLSDVSLSNVSIFKSDGDTLDIDRIVEMSDKFDEYDIKFIDLSNIVNERIPNEILTKIISLSSEFYNTIQEIDTKIQLTSNKIDTEVSNLSVELYNKINGGSNELYDMISTVSGEIYDKISTVSGEICNDITNVALDLRTTKDELLSNISNLDKKVDDNTEIINSTINTKNNETVEQLTEKILNDKHYSFNTVNVNQEPFKIKDFNINIINCTNKNGLVYYKQTPIGRIENLIKNEQLIKSFDFITFDDINDDDVKKCFPLHSTTYRFNEKQLTHEVLYGYNLNVNNIDSNDISNVTFTLSRHASKYRPVFLDNVYVGSIINEKTDNNGKILSGTLEIQSGGDVRLQKFNHKSVNFNGDITSYTFKNDTDSLSSKIVVDTLNKIVILQENFSSEERINIQNKQNNYINIGYIRKSDISSDGFTANIEDCDIEIFNTKVVLNNQNSYKYDYSKDYAIKYENNTLRGYEKQLYYKYNLSCYDISNNIKTSSIFIVPELKNRLIDEQDFDVLSVYYDDKSFEGFSHSGCIILNRENNFTNYDNYDSGRLMIKFDEVTKKIDTIIDFSSGSVLNETYFYDKKQNDVFSNTDNIIFISPNNIDIKNPSFIISNTPPELTYKLSFGVIEMDNYDTYVLYINGSDSKDITLELPKQQFTQNVSHEFIVKIKVDSQENQKLYLSFVDGETVEFGSQNEVFINTGSDYTLLFKQLPHKNGKKHYIVYDLNDNLTTELINELSNSIINERQERQERHNQLQSLIFEEQSIRQTNDLEIKDIIENEKNQIYEKIQELNTSLSSEQSIRLITDNNLLLEINDISSDVESLSTKFSDSKTQIEDKILWIQNRISCIINYRGQLNIDELNPSGVDLSTVFYKNGISDGSLSVGWFYLITSSGENKDYRYIEGKKIGNGDYIRIERDIDIIKNISISDITITDIMDSDIVHQNQLDETNLSVDQIFSILNETHLSVSCISSIVDNNIDDIKTIASDLENEIKQRHDDVQLLTSDIVNITNNIGIIEKDVSNISDSLSSVSSMYNEFVDNNFITNTNYQHDEKIKSICIMDESEPHEKYYTTFKNGTLVLVKIKN